MLVTVQFLGRIIVFNNGDFWTFYVGDAYYLRAEIEDENHPVEQLAKIRAMNDEMRLQTLRKLRIFINEHGNEIKYFGYHDPSEFIIESYFLND